MSGEGETERLLFVGGPWDEETPAHVRGLQLTSSLDPQETGSARYEVAKWGIKALRFYVSVYGRMSALPESAALRNVPVQAPAEVAPKNRKGAK